MQQRTIAVMIGMRGRLGAAAMLMAIPLAGCDSTPPFTPIRQQVDGFGRNCVTASDCQTGVLCFTFGDGDRRCTVTCRFDGECPAGATGARCDGQGYCKP